MRTYSVEYKDADPDVTRTWNTDVDADTFTICNENGVLYVMFFEFPTDDDGEMTPVGMFPYDGIISITSVIENNKKVGDSE